MVQAIQFRQNSMLPLMEENAKSSTHPLSSRIQINWDKVILLANTALILAGIAFAFFMKLPLIMIGLAGYGALYVSLWNLAQKNRSDPAELHRLQTLLDLKEKTIKELKEEKKKILEGRDVTPAMKAEIAKLTKDRENAQDQVGTLKDEIARMSKEKDNLMRTLADLREKERVARAK